ncbi:biosynthetic peptidoglycan transglycosylase [Flavobacterium sp. NRK F7]|uniref:biosynthetic peptidoglycan transglycosylase n=1 Tax=Flavobacterium sp. NRK F7 TaxID=2954930 RepID=UPI002090560A|nr:biosynthetic peptidoglycan transglycosylase [Flavobacterium sp. NRK F7]MCO6164248.1 transglycosylase domain-containing protein [Flavobacterium sp. NRK F7]
MESKAEQYYPTYTFKSEHRDIVLLEFEEAQKIANTQTKVYGQVANILIAVTTILIPLFFNQDTDEKEKTLTIIQSNSLVFSLILIAFGGILLRYFVELQRQITINARKVVSLRAMLGLDYGSIHLTLPNWRVEGANNPFVIKYFNGWFWFQTVPFWVLTIGLNVIWWLATNQKESILIQYLPFEIKWFYGNILLTIWYLFIFRHHLNEQHETNYLNFIKFFCKIFRIKLMDNFEYILYRAKLSYIELERLNVKYDVLKKILIDIEDKDFKTNSGISFKSLLRGALSRFKFLRNKSGYIKHGGSTITMQLSRSLFIPSNQNKYRRKITEIFLSLWLNKQFKKDEILKLYISSVRFERGVLGLSNAIKYFLGELKDKELTKEESFFLVERLSNITSTVNWQRIDHLKNRTKLVIDSEKLTEVYKKQIENRKLKE